MNYIHLYTDGGARGNPGPAGIGCIAYDGESTLFTISAYIGETTNNQAEYRALLKGVEKLISLSVKNVECFLDSQLIVNQLNGLYKVRNLDLKPLYDKIIKLTSKFNSISFTHIERSKNKEPDKLVNIALDKQKTPT